MLVKALLYLIYLSFFSYQFAIRGFIDGAIGRPTDVDYLKAHLLYFAQTDLPAISIGLVAIIYTLIYDFTPTNIISVLIMAIIAATTFYTVFSYFYELGEKYREAMRCKKAK